MIQQPTPVAASRRASIPPSRHSRYLIIAPSPLPCQGEKFKSQFTMPKKNDAPASFETALSELEQIVTRLESGDLPLEDALNEFERGVQLARQGQVNSSRPSSVCRSCFPTAKTLKPRHSHRTPSKWIFQRASGARHPRQRCAAPIH